MAGNTNNTNFLSAANEHIRAVNDADANASIQAVEAAVTAVDAGPHIDGLSVALVNALTMLASALERIAANQEVQTVYPPPATPTPTGPVPDPLTDPPPNGEPTWDNYLCRSGYAFCEAQAELFDDLGEINGSPVWAFAGIVAALCAIVVSLASGGVIVISAAAAGSIGAIGLAAALWEVIGQLSEGVLDTTFAAIADEYRTNAQLRSCIGAAMKNGDGVTDKTQLIKDAIDANMTANQEIAKLAVADFRVAPFAQGVEQDGQIVYPTYDGTVDCSCQGEMLTLTIDPLDPAWVLAGNYIVDQQNGYVELRRHGASTGGESSMTLSLAAIRAALGYTDPLYALDAEIEGICYVDPCSYRTVYLQAQFSLYDAPGPPTGTAVWRGTHNNVCITNTGTAGCFPAGTEEPFSIAAMTVPNDPYGAAPNGFRLTTYRPIASGGDSACWGWFRITSVKIKFCKQPLAAGQCA